MDYQRHPTHNSTAVLSMVTDYMLMGEVCTSNEEKTSALIDKK